MSTMWTANKTCPGPGSRWALALAVLLMSSPVAAQRLPAEVLTALQRANVPPEAISVVVQETGSGRNALLWQEQRSRNPASLMKLLTTMAALERLGPSLHLDDAGVAERAAAATACSKARCSSRAAATPSW